MTNYEVVFFFLQKYHLMQKSTLSVIVQYHFKISVLQHCLQQNEIRKNISSASSSECKNKIVFKRKKFFKNLSFEVEF